jgi:hypothetical protein
MAGSCKHGNWISGSMKAVIVLTSGAAIIFLIKRCAPKVYAFTYPNEEYET